MFHCPPCGKTFTGPACYDAHVKSEKHKKKLLSFQTKGNSLSLDSNEVTASDTMDSTKDTTSEAGSQSAFKCHVCDISFNSFESYQDHTETSSHAVKVMLKKTESKVYCSAVSSSSESSENPKVNDNKEKKLEYEEILSGFSCYTNSQILSFAACETCNMSFTGSEPYKQHMESAKHKKKVELQKISEENPSVFFCEICRVHLSGQMPYIQHMSSDKHKKKESILALQNLSANSPSRNQECDSGEKRSDLVNLWFCNSCNVQCSGLISYEQHLQGSSHLKRAKRGQVTVSKLEVEPALPENSSSGGGILEKPMDVGVPLNGSVQNDNEAMKNDLILPELEDKLKVVTCDELAVLMKIFHPDEEVDFDKIGKKEDERMLTDSVNENTDHEVLSKPGENNECTSSDVSLEITHEIIEESPAYEVCHICDVKLFDKAEAVKHYESIEHFKKRWGSDYVAQVLEE